MAVDGALWLTKLSHLSLTDEKRSRIEYVRGQAHLEPEWRYQGTKVLKKRCGNGKSTSGR
jgi:hypothetical protein